MTGTDSSLSPEPEQQAHNSFAVYFNGAVHIRQSLGLVVTLCFTIAFLYIINRHASPVVCWIALSIGIVLIVLRHAFYIVSYYSYTSFCKNRKAWLEFDKAGIKIYGTIYFPWAAISSLGHINNVYTAERGGMRNSYLILNFPDKRAMSSVPPDYRAQLTEYANMIKIFARKSDVHLNENFAAIVVRGGGILSSNLSATDTLIESMSDHYFNHARDAAKQAMADGRPAQ